MVFCVHLPEGHGFAFLTLGISARSYRPILKFRRLVFMTQWDQPVTKRAVLGRSLLSRCLIGWERLRRRVGYPQSSKKWMSVR